MKQMKKVLAIVLVLCTVTLLFAACGKTPDKQIIGKWTESSGYFGIEFHEDNIITYEVISNQAPGSLLDGLAGLVNSVVADNAKGSYSIVKKDDGQYYITLNFSSIASISGEYLFTIEGQTLTLKDPTTGEGKFVLYQRAEETTTAAQ
ncbi:MAG: hypothetical protein NC122_07615 [Faecalibacterium sp.]|nr:hypothetical protein [Ruminococcus sp.]MCM1392633.1 hypothetical protein [Ruminococcus sp.]MCM1486060.1 hypothetical protein [Faecalibacterium sp.]